MEKMAFSPTCPGSITLTADFRRCGAQQRHPPPANCHALQRDQTHQELGITLAHLNALVEDLQTAMDKQAIGFGAQSRLLALLKLLAPLHRDIIKPKQ